MGVKKLNKRMLPNGEKVENLGANGYGRVSATEWNDLVSAAGALIDAHNEVADALSDKESGERWVTAEELAAMEEAHTVEDGVTYFVYEEEETSGQSSTEGDGTGGDADDEAGTGPGADAPGTVAEAEETAAGGSGETAAGEGEEAAGGSEEAAGGSGETAGGSGETAGGNTEGTPAEETGAS